jgi:hypothetical protein
MNRRLELLVHNTLFMTKKHPKGLHFNLVNKGLLTVSLLALLSLGTYVQAQNLDGITKRDPFVLSGSVSSGTSFYTVAGRENRRNPFAYFLNVAPTVEDRLVILKHEK